MSESSEIWDSDLNRPHTLSHLLGCCLAADCNCDGKTPRNQQAGFFFPLPGICGWFPTNPFGYYSLQTPISYYYFITIILGIVIIINFCRVNSLTQLPTHTYVCWYIDSFPPPLPMLPSPSPHCSHSCAVIAGSLPCMEERSATWTGTSAWIYCDTAHLLGPALSVSRSSNLSEHSE